MNRPEVQRQRVGIVGVGAMGSIYAALFAAAGHQVWGIDPWRAHREAITAHGLHVSGFGGDRRVKINVSATVAEADRCDLYVVATKAAHVGVAAESIAAHLMASATVVTIQNGLGAAERVLRHLPADQVLLGVAQGFGARMVGPGHAHLTGMQMLRLGEVSGGFTPRLERITDLWAHAGFPVTAFENIEQLIWEKFICNVALGAPSLVSGLTAGELLADEHWREVAMGCATEAFTIARAQNIPISYNDPVAYVEAFVARVADAKPSMLQDYEAGRPSELDAINGQVPVLGRRVNVATPHNDAICQRVRAMEAAREAARESNVSN